MLMRFISATIAVLIGACSPAISQVTCDIHPAKRELIKKVLCGEGAEESVYREYGKGCFKRSAAKRLEDTAGQISIYRLCGFDAFADEMEGGILKSMEFMEQLSVCVAQEANLSEILNDRTEFVRTKARGMKCTAELRAHAVRRKPAFDAMIKQTNDPNFTMLIFVKLHIQVDEHGNVTDLR